MPGASGLDDVLSLITPQEKLQAFFRGAFAVNWPSDGADLRMRIPSRILAVLSWASLAALPSPGSTQAVDDGHAEGTPQAAEALASGTRQEWKLRVDQSKLRAKQFNSLAKAGLLNPSPPSADEIALEASSTVLNDQGLRPGDIVSTVSGLFVYRGQYGSDPKPGDFVPAPPNFLHQAK
jgi:hypothetical protein